MESDYDKWKNGELVFYREGDVLIHVTDEEYVESKQYYINKYGEEKGLEYLRDEYFSFDEYSDYTNSNYDTFKEEFTIPSGEKVISFGYYGYE
jgi:hypothetical protein